MKKTVLKFGMYGLVLAMVLFISVLLIGKDLDFSTQEILGYLTMTISLSFIYFGMKYFRDHENNGRLSFTRGVLIGLLIATFAALGIAIADFIYLTAINPDFFEGYTAVMRSEGFKGEIPDYGNGFMAFIMFLTVMIIGLIISLLAALVLQRKNTNYDLES